MAAEVILSAEQVAAVEALNEDENGEGIATVFKNMFGPVIFRRAKMAWKDEFFDRVCVALFAQYAPVTILPAGSNQGTPKFSDPVKAAIFGLQRAVEDLAARDMRERVLKTLWSYQFPDWGDVPTNEEIAADYDSAIELATAAYRVALEGVRQRREEIDASYVEHRDTARYMDQIERHDAQTKKDRDAYDQANDRANAERKEQQGKQAAARHINAKRQEMLLYGCVGVVTLEDLDSIAPHDLRVLNFILTGEKISILKLGVRAEA